MTYLTEIKPKSSIYVTDNVMPGDLCEELIERFEKCPDKKKGRVSGGVFEEIKKSSDLFISNHPDFKDLDQRIFQTLEGPFQEFMNNVLVNFRYVRDEGYILQRTQPGEFYLTHFDQDEIYPNRQLAALFYLNDVEQGGETDFPYLDVRVKPRKGRLCLFPPFWTHKHAGLPPISNTKYIISTWLGWDLKKVAAES